MDNTKERLEFYKEIYYFELNRKDNLKSKLIIPSSITALFFTVIGYLFRNLKAAPSGLLGVLFIVSFVLLFLSFIYNIYNFFKAWQGDKYAYLPKSTEMEEYWHELEKAYSEPEVVKEKFNTFLIKKLKKHNDQNFKNNKRLAETLLKIHKTIIVSLVFTIVSLVCLYGPQFYFIINNILCCK